MTRAQSGKVSKRKSEHAWGKARNLEAVCLEENGVLEGGDRRQLDGGQPAAPPFALKGFTGKYYSPPLSVSQRAGTQQVPNRQPADEQCLGGSLKVRRWK